MRFDETRPSARVLVLLNFSDTHQNLDLQTLSTSGFGFYSQLMDLYTGKRITGLNVYRRDAHRGAAALGE